MDCGGGVSARNLGIAGDQTIKLKAGKESGRCTEHGGEPDMSNKFVDKGVCMRWQEKVAAKRNPIQSGVEQASIDGSLSFGDAAPQIALLNLLFLVSIVA